MTIRLAVSLVLLAAFPAATQDIEYRTVVLRGGSPPGVPGAVTFRTFGDPMIADDGSVAFEATIAGVGVTADSDEGFWAEKNGVLTLIAREGDPAPGQPAGVVFDRIINPVINANGNAAFRAWLSGPGIDINNRDSIYAETDGNPLALVVQGGTPSGVSGVDIGGFTTVLMGNHDRIVAKTFLAGPTVNPNNDEGVILQTSASTVALVAREGDQAAGTSPGVLYSIIDVTTVNDAGIAIMEGDVAGPGVDAFNRDAIWVAPTSGAVTLAARAGQAAPGASGDSFLAIGSARLNDSGAFVFLGSLIGPGVTFDNGAGIWRSAVGGSSQLVLRTGGAGAGGNPGETFGVLFTPSIDASGDITFSGEFGGPAVPPLEKRAIWQGDPPSPFGLLVRGGDAPSGAGPGVVFSTINTPATNDTGDIVFPALLTGPGISFNNRDVLARRTDADSVILARVGVFFDIDDDPNFADERLVVAPIQFVEGSGGRDGHPTGLNERGDAAFTLNFGQNFTGVFVALAEGTDCLADTNGDGLLTPADFNAWILAFNNQTPACDQNADGVCTPADFNAWILNFNAGCNELRR